MDAPKSLFSLLAEAIDLALMARHVRWNIPEQEVWKQERAMEVERQANDWAEELALYMNKAGLAPNGTTLSIFQWSRLPDELAPDLSALEKALTQIQSDCEQSCARSTGLENLARQVREAGVRLSTRQSPRRGMDGARRVISIASSE